MSLFKAIAAMRSRGASAAPVDTTPPTVVSATTISATQIRIVFSEPVNVTIVGWTFNNGSTLTPSAVTGSGTTWTFTVSGLAFGQTITRSYSSAAGATMDTAGNELASFTAAAVTNTLLETTPPTVVSMVVNNANPDRIVVTFSESVNPTVVGWLFRKQGTTWGISSLTGSGSVWTFTMNSPATNGDPLTAQYNATAGTTADLAGNKLATFTSTSVTNNVNPPAVLPTIIDAYVNAEYPEWIELFLSVNMDPNSIPVTNRFTPSGGRTVTRVDVAGFGQVANQVSLLVDIPYTSGDTISLDYLKPLTGMLRDTSLNEVASFSAFPIDNLIGGAPPGDTTPPTVLSITATSATNIRVVFDENTTPTTAGWTFNNGGAITPSAVAGSGQTWDFTVAGLAAGQSITAAYSTTTGNTLDTAGNELATFTGRTVTNAIPSGSTTPLTFTAIPYSSAEIRRPGAGAEDWQGQHSEGQGVDVPTEGAHQVPKDVYRRSSYTWARFEPTQGNYDFSLLGQDIRAAIDAGQKLGFGVMSVYFGDDTSNPSPTAGGIGMSYPLYLHNLMQAEANNSRDWIGNSFYWSGQWWIPNYNSPNYLARMDALNQAIAGYLNSNSHNGVLYRHAIGYIDIRGVGNFGEWHHYPYAQEVNTDIPPGRAPQLASLQNIIDSHCNRFDAYQLCVIVSAFDCNWLANTRMPTGIATYILDKTYGGTKKIGIRRDNWGSGDSYISSWMENNDRATLGGQPVSFHIMERWKYAPIMGEPNNGGDGSGANAYNRMESEVNFYRAVTFGNGNFMNVLPLSTANKNYIRAASKRAGFRLKLNTGWITTGITRGTPFSLSLTWENEGITPTYENWSVIFQLRSGATVVWSGTSSFNPRLFLPGTQTVVDSLTVPVGVPAGTYNLHMIIRDPNWSARIMPLHITGVQGDGSYILKTNVAIL